VNHYKTFLRLGFWGGALAVFWLIVSHSYFLFHGVAEIFSIAVASGVFFLAWNTKDLSENDYVSFLGIGLFSVAVLDLFHTLAFEGTGLFTGHRTNTSVQLWIAGRYTECLVFLVAPYFLRHKLRKYLAFFGQLLWVGLIFASIFYFKIFPGCYPDDRHWTAFKISSEYIITAIFLLAAINLYRHRLMFSATVYKYLIAAILVKSAAEVTFTMYWSDNYIYYNMLGHYGKVISFYFIYKAIIESGIKDPFSVLVHNLKIREELYETLAKNLPETAVMIFDKNFNYTLAEGEVLQTVGLSRAAIEGKGVHEIFPEEINAVLIPKFEAALAGRRSNLELQWCGRFFHVHTLPVRTDSGDVFAGLIMTLDITDRKQMELALEKAAATDRLTGIHNREKIETELENELERSRRYDSTMSLIMFDIDFFKNINDTHGHSSGDQVLRYIACIVSNNVRSVDYFGRWGGEEFMLVLPETGIEAAGLLAEKLRRLIEHCAVDNIRGITCSFGVAQLEEMDSPGRIIKRVDAALYLAKRNGRNRVEIA